MNSPSDRRRESFTTQGTILCAPVFPIYRHALRKTPLRSLLVILLSVVALSSFASDGARLSLRLSIVPEESSEHGLCVSIYQPFHVVVTNQSDAPVTVWREWCSWGYFSLSLEIKAQDGAISRLTKQSRGWDRNFPCPYVIRSGMPFVLAVRLKDEWSGYPAHTQKISMRARYISQPDTTFGSHKQVWVGEVTSPWIEVTVTARE